MSRAFQQGSAFKRMALQSAVYTVANALTKASGLILLRLQTDADLLPVEQFGLISVLTAVNGVVAPVLSLALSLALLHVLARPDDPDREAAPFTAWTLAAAVVVTVCGAAWLAAEPLGRWLFDNPEAGVDPARYLSLGRAVVATVAFEALGHAGFALAQERERVLFYGGTLMTRFAVLIGAHAVLLVGLGWGLEGALWSYALAGAVSATVTSGFLLASVRRLFSLRAARRMVTFSAPLLINAMALPFLYAGDRLLLEHLASALTLGIYDLASKLAGVLNVILVQGFQVAFNAVGMKEHARVGGAGLHRRTFRHYVVFSGGFALGLSLFAADVLPVFVDAGGAELLAAERYVFPLALGLMGYGLYLILVNPLLARGLTRRISAVVFAAAALNLLLNVLLIPQAGALGAALATLAAYGLLAAGAGVLAQRAEGVRFRWEHLAAVLVVVCALYGVSRMLVDADLWARLGGKATLMALYPFGVLAGGVYRWGEVRRGAQTVLRRMRAPRR